MVDKIVSIFREHKNKVIIITAALFLLDVLIWLQIFGVASAGDNLEVYFLDVGQGDGSLVVLPGGVEVLIDGGPPNGRVLQELGEILERGDRYIDLVVLSHPQFDHFGGLVEVLRRYEVGVLIWNGIEGPSAAFEEFVGVVRGGNIPEVVLRAGDKISYGGSEFRVLSPGPEALMAKDVNDTSLVLELEAKNSKTLFTGDISAAIERALSLEDIDVLKVPHHGSKFSSSANFLNAVRPEAAVVEVGRNSYGHPTDETLLRIKDVGAQVFRTDLEGTVRFVVDGERIRIFKNELLTGKRE